jgi:hypothetical protein
MGFTNRTSHSRKPLLLAAALMAICTFTTAANAQSQSVRRFTLPYEVKWNNKVVPAGEYTITTMNADHAHVAFIRSANGRWAMNTLVPKVFNSWKGGDALLITMIGHQHTIISLNLPELGYSLVYQAIPLSEREILAKSGRLETVPVVVAKK